tara:strand:- start:512 stop:715 length:204 start_codon:yes stop_codon:yes gene_type:complete
LIPESIWGNGRAMLIVASVNRTSDSVFRVTRVMGPCEITTEQNAMSPKVTMVIGLKIMWVESVNDRL